jgi:hypothetical protein
LARIQSNVARSKSLNERINQRGIESELKQAAAREAEQQPVKSRVQENKSAGDAIRDVIAAREGAGAEIEQNLRVTGGLRRVDVLVDKKIAIESKVGRTGLTERTRQELARDVKLLRSGQVEKVQWEFSKSNVTGKSGPTGPLRKKLNKFGIEIVE